MKTKRSEFIHSMILRNSFNAAVKRSGIYERNDSLKDRELFRDECKNRLSAFGSQYDYDTYTDEKWCRNIEELSESLSEKYPNSKKDKWVTIGVTQKMISLYLKYLWCLGDDSKKPLFAVLDREIIQKATNKNISWTCIDSIKCYLKLVKAVESYAKKEGYDSGACWELNAWGDAFG